MWGRNPNTTRRWLLPPLSMLNRIENFVVQAKKSINLICQRTPFNVLGLKLRNLLVDLFVICKQSGSPAWRRYHPITRDFIKLATEQRFRWSRNQWRAKDFAMGNNLMSFLLFAFLPLFFLFLSFTKLSPHLNRLTDFPALPNTCPFCSSIMLASPMCKEETSYKWEICEITDASRWKLITWAQKSTSDV